MEKKKIFIIIGIVVLVLAIAGVVVTLLANNKGKSILTATEVQNIVMQKVNNHDIYIDDIGKVKSIKDVKYIETIDSIEYWKMNIDYELSSLSAPVGQNYSGTSLSGTFCFAYNTETKKSYEYMFEISEYERLKGWSKTHKDDSSDWK